MPPRSSFSICLSIFSFSREGSKATLVLVCLIFFFRISLLEASSQGNPEISTDSPSPEFSSQVCSNSNSSCITSKPDALSSSIPLMFGFTNHSLSLFACMISWSVASFRFHAEGPLPARKNCFIQYRAQRWLWCHLRRYEFMRFLYYYALSPVSDVIRI